jgi:protein-S-isoprenylcysteine O-methyltransferase Ste14
VLGQLVLLGFVIVLGTRSGIPSFGNAGFMGWLSFVIGAGGLAIGAWLLLRGIVDLGRSLTPLPRPRADARLVESGIYATLRHPIYAGMIAASVGWSVFTRSPAALVVALLLAALLDAKARREEAWLLDRYPPYAAYRLRTKRFLPGVY